MNIWKIIGLAFLGLIIVVGLPFMLGWTNVFYTKTVGKAKQNAQREVFEQTQSYVEGKRQEAVKYRLEYMRGDENDKAAIKMMIAQSFANFDENKLDETLRSFVYKMKYQ